MRISGARTSVRWGLRRAAQLWAVVLIVWIASLAAFLPAMEVIGGAVGEALANLPPAPFEPPPGDVMILMSGAMGDAIAPLGLALVSAVVFLWAFTSLWHAGVARWEVWDGDGPRSPSRVFGLGLGSWFSYLRLSLTAFVVFMATVVTVSSIGFSQVRAAFGQAREGRGMLWMAAMLVVLALVKTVVWLATLRGAWELARPAASSAVMAWMRGFVGVWLHPITSVLPVLVLGLPMVLLAEAPLVLGILVPPLRFGVLAWVVTGLLTLASSYFAVALYEAYAPLSEVAGPVE